MYVGSLDLYMYTLLATCQFDDDFAEVSIIVLNFTIDGLTAQAGHS